MCAVVSVKGVVGMCSAVLLTGDYHTLDFLPKGLKSV